MHRFENLGPSKNALANNQQRHSLMSISIRSIFDAQAAIPCLLTRVPPSAVYVVYVTFEFLITNDTTPLRFRPFSTPLPVLQSPFRHPYARPAFSVE